MTMTNAMDVAISPASVAADPAPAARPERKPFDRYIAGTKPSWKRRAWSLASIVLHAIAGVIILWVSAHVVKAASEVTEVTFVKKAAPPTPPPPPVQDTAKPKTAARSAMAAKAIVQPVAIPTSAPKAVSNDDEYGVVGGVVGGVAGGVVGGIVPETPVAAPPPPPGVYERVSHAPRLVAGDREPVIPASMMLALRGSSGVILAKIKINVHGGVDSVQIVNSTLPLLDDVVKRQIEATWRFDPPINAGRPAAVEFLQPFSFNFG